MRYGVERLDVCGANLDALCLLDMKCFFYLVCYQSLAATTDERFARPTRPYWLESALCTREQHDWWFAATQHMLSKSIVAPGSSLALSNTVVVDQHPLLVPTSKQQKQQPQAQSDLLKIVELVRLKSSWVRLSTSGGGGDKLKPNLRLCVHVAKQLQQLVDADADAERHSQKGGDLTTTSPSKAANLTASSSSSEAHTTPKEKMRLMRKYALAYWTYCCRQLIKLRQMDAQDDDLSPVAHASGKTRGSLVAGSSSAAAVAYRNYFTCNLTTTTTTTTQLFNTSQATMTKTTPRLSMGSNVSSVNVKSSMSSTGAVVGEEEDIFGRTMSLEQRAEYDSLIQTGLLNIALNHIVSASTTPVDRLAVGDEDDEDLSCLDEAINAFELMEATTSGHHFDFSHLQVNATHIRLSDSKL